MRKVRQPIEAIDATQVAHFASQIEGAAAILNAAHIMRGTVVVPSMAEHLSPSEMPGLWYAGLVRYVTARAGSVLDALRSYQVDDKAVSADFAAFKLLSSLTPSEKALELLLYRNRSEAVDILNDQLMLVCKQWLTAVDAAEKAERTEATASGSGVQPSFNTSALKLLKEAGGSYSLSEASVMLDITRQALHKRITKGTMLGMLLNNEIVVPKMQFTSGKRPHLVNGIAQIIKPFLETGAGKWAALQFLVEPDPNLGAAPIDILKKGRIDAVITAARSYLSLEEE